MAEEVISISDSDEEAVPFPSASTTSTATTTAKQKHLPTAGSSTPTTSARSESALSSSMSNLDLNNRSSFDSMFGSSIYKPLGADLIAARQMQAMKKKRLPMLHPFPVVRDVVYKLRSAIGTNDSQRNILSLAQQYITSLKYYQSKGVGNCPNRCRLLARHVTRTMCLIRDLSRKFFDSPHYSQKICELLAIYIFFELKCAGDFKDSKVKIAERIIINIHLHLENAQSNFFLRIFAFLNNMCKENEIATKIFQRLIPEPMVMVKNEFPDRLYVQYLIVFYHWKEAWNDYEDQQKIVAFANKFMKPMSTIKSNKIYAKHLPSYVRRDDATGYFLQNMVFFNDLRTASILDGIEDNGPILVDLSNDERVYPSVDLSEVRMEPTQPLVQLAKVEPQELDETVDLTADDDDTWLKKLIRRAVTLEVSLPARLLPREKDQVAAVIEVHDSDNENLNENTDDVWAFGSRNEKEQQSQPQTQAQSQPQPQKEQTTEVVREKPQNCNEDSDTLSDMFNEMNSSIDFGDESTTESEIRRKKDQKERVEYAAKLTDAQVRTTFYGVVEKELKSMSIINPPKARTVISAEKEKEVVSSGSSLVPSTSASVSTSSTNSVLPQEDAPAESTTSVKSTSSMQSATTEIVSVPADEPSVSSAVEALASKSVKSTDTISVSNVENGKNVTCPSKEVVVEATKSSLFSSSPEVSEKSSSLDEDLDVNETNTTSQQETSENNEQITLFDSEITRDVQNNSSIKRRTESNAPTAEITSLQVTQSPRDAITYSLDETLISSWDSSDESDEDFLGRFQKPPFKTYLRRAYTKTSKKDTKNTTNANISSNFSEDEMNSTEKLPPNEKITEDLHDTSKDVPQSENPNVLFSGKVISLREEETSGGTTPNYLHTPESIEISKHGTNVVFSMQGRRLSSFPPLEVTSNEHSMPDFDVDNTMTGEEDNNSRTEETSPRKKSYKKSIIASNSKKAKSSQGSDKKRSKAKSVWFAERPQVREIESRKSTPPPYKISSLNTITTTINKISNNKQHFESPSTHKSTINKPTLNLIESLKHFKPNHLIQNRSNPITTESSAVTEALKSAQEKDLLQKLFPEAFALPASKPERPNSASKNPVLIKAAISHERRLSSFDDNQFLNKTSGHRRKSVSGGSYEKQQQQQQHQIQSDFDRYLSRKKLLKPSKQYQQQQQQQQTTRVRSAKTETNKSARRGRKTDAKTLAIIENDPKLGNQMKPIVVLNSVVGPVFIDTSSKSDGPHETFTQISPGVFKLKRSPVPVPVPQQQQHQSQQTARLPSLVTSAKQIVGIRTKSLSDILSDVVVQELTASVPKGQMDKVRDEQSPAALLVDVPNVEKQKQLEVNALASPIVAVTTVIEEKEKEEEGSKIEEDPVQTKIVPLMNASVKTQEDIELKLIKKEEVDMKSSSPEATARLKAASKSVADCFKKPLKSMTQKRSQSTIKIVQTPVGPDTIMSSPKRLEIQEPVTSTNSCYIYPPLTSESESDSSIRTEQTGDVESSEQSDCSLSTSVKRLKIKLRRLPTPKKQMENNVTKSPSSEKTVAADCSTSKSRVKKNQEQRSESRIGEKTVGRADSSTSSSVLSAVSLDQRRPQSGLINGVLVPSIEAMNTPPPTPPTTVDDKSSVADDTSQEAKSQTSSESSVATAPHDPSTTHPPANCQNIDNEHDVKQNNDHVLSINNPPTEIRLIDEEIQSRADQVQDSKSWPVQRRRFESVSLPSTHKRPRKKAAAEASDSDDCHSKESARVKKRRKTICTDVFNPPDYSSDEEVCPTKAAADSPSVDSLRRRANDLSWIKSVKIPSSPSSSTVYSTDIQSVDTSNVRLDSEEISVSPPPTTHQNDSENVCDSSRLSPTTTTALSPISKVSSTPADESSNKTENENYDGSPLRSSTPNCDSPLTTLTTPQNLAVSRTYSKSYMVQQVFVPPEIEMFIEQPASIFGVADDATPCNVVSTSTPASTSLPPGRVEKNSNQRQRKAKTFRKKFARFNDEEAEDKEEKEDSDDGDGDYHPQARNPRKKTQRGRKSAIRSKRQ